MLDREKPAFIDWTEFSWKLKNLDNSRNFVNHLDDDDDDDDNSHKKSIIQYYWVVQ